MTISSIGVGLIGTNVAVGSIPPLSGTASEANLKGNFSKGLANVGTALPTMGKMKGTGMVLKSLKKIKMKGGRKL